MRHLSTTVKLYILEDNPWKEFVGGLIKALNAPSDVRPDYAILKLGEDELQIIHKENTAETKCFLRTKDEAAFKSTRAFLLAYATKYGWRRASGQYMERVPYANSEPSESEFYAVLLGNPGKASWPDSFTVIHNPNYPGYSLEQTNESAVEDFLPSPRWKKHQPRRTERQRTGLLGYSLAALLGAGLVVSGMLLQRNWQKK